ncbi:MAG TPA: histidine--tRNA ligase [Clostridia bacterium]|jgi:histidyl-tRNA synthetase|nr:histidine--tRNA ligase [Clostridia bacterium]
MIRIPRGTKDVLPTESYKWQKVEDIVRKIGNMFGFQEIRTPTFESTELFLRGVGETTDIVSKEMYTFLDKGDRSITLKPEGTAGVARAFVENGLSSTTQPLKMYYITPVFRYETPQAGRLREHHQFGVELFGSESPYADLEVILLAREVFKQLDVSSVYLKINNIGCPVCRKNYNTLLTEYLKEHTDKLCQTCNERLYKNPLRVLDCKIDTCEAVKAQAPKITDHLCPNCLNHHSLLIDLLNVSNIEYVIDPYLVRGLDYYTGTVFEFVSRVIGSQGTVCGGGRYNNLITEVGGSSTPAVGFGMGIERLLLLLEANGYEFIDDTKPIVYTAPYNQNCYEQALEIANSLRNAGIACEIDIVGRSLKAQLKYANKKGFKFVLVIGENEIKSSTVSLKNFETGEELSIKKEELVSFIKNNLA